jgi:hypothetical protein
MPAMPVGYAGWCVGDLKIFCDCCCISSRQNFGFAKARCGMKNSTVGATTHTLI